MLRSINLVLDIYLMFCSLLDSQITFFNQLGRYHAFTALLVNYNSMIEVQYNRSSELSKIRYD